VEWESWWVRRHWTQFSFNRDLLEDKESLFDSVKQVLLVLAAMNGAHQSMTSHAAAAADDQLLVAIDIAERLVSEGVPFRQAHEVAGALVGRAVRGGKSLADVVAEDSSLAQ
jgi:argininosuccinate lyase